jgi:hypothetical protein
MGEMMARAWAQMGIINSLARQPNARDCIALPYPDSPAPQAGRYGE